MKKVKLLWVAIFVSFAAKGQTYNVSISIPEALPNARAYIKIGEMADTVNFFNGKAVFSGNISEPLLATINIAYSGPRGFLHYYDFFLAPGSTNMQVSDITGKDSLTIRGPQYALDYQYKLLNPVMEFNKLNHACYARYAEAKKNGLADTSKFLALENEAIRNCFQVPQNYIKANPSSPVCICALKMMGRGPGGVTGVTTEILSALYDSLSTGVKQTEEGKKYMKWLRTPPTKFQ